MKIVLVERRSPVLTSSSLACLAHTPAINLTSGCAHACVYCYARGYSTYPRQGAVVVYKNTLEKLKNEILGKRTKPKKVYFSPSSDIFQPIPEVSELAYSVLSFLFSRGIDIAFLTKGFIPDKMMALLTSNADMVRAQVGIITADDDIRRAFEPDAAPINIRLQQMKKLVAAGIAVEARMMLVLPGITDSPDSLDRLFGAIADVGVKKTAMSTLFLRSAIINSLKMRMPDKHGTRLLLDSYGNSTPLAVHAGRSSVIPLPRAMREDIYARVKNIAEKYAIDISVCGCMNPDIGGACNISGIWPARSCDVIQPDLFSSGVGVR